MRKMMTVATMNLDPVCQGKQESAMTQDVQHSTIYHLQTWKKQSRRGEMIG